MKNSPNTSTQKLRSRPELYHVWVANDLAMREQKTGAQVFSAQQPPQVSLVINQPAVTATARKSIAQHREHRKDSKKRKKRSMTKNSQQSHETLKILV